MSVPPYVHFFGNDWFTGVIGLKADERGVYISMCVYIWTAGRRVPLCDAEASRMMGLQFNNYQRIRDGLVAKGKVQKHADGYGIKRAETELDRARDRLLAGNGPGRRVHEAVEGGIAERAEGANQVLPAHGEGAEAGGALLGASAGALPCASVGAPMGASAGACLGSVENSEQNQGAFLYPEPEPEKYNPPTPLQGERRKVRVKKSYSEAFEAFWQAYPSPQASSKAKAFEVWEKLDADEHAKATAAVPGYVAILKAKPDRPACHAATFLNQRRWETIGTAPSDAKPEFWWQDPAKVAAMTPERWRSGIERFANGKWGMKELGFWPGHPKCLVPREIIAELHLDEKYDANTGIAKGAWKRQQDQLHREHAA